MLTDTRRQEHHDAPYAVRTLTGPASTRLHLEAVPREVPPPLPGPASSCTRRAFLDWLLVRPCPAIRMLLAAAPGRRSVTARARNF